jgi:dolichol-phosphate mannosyltransferase
LPKGFLDLLTVSFLTGFSHRPQHLIGSVGLASFVAGCVGMIWLAIYWVLRMTYFPEWIPLHERPLMLYSLGALLLGSQLLCMGFLAELMVAKGQDAQEPYSIRERV